MVNKCSAVNCKSGYEGQAKDPDLSFHAFPLDDKELLILWLSRIARKDFIPNKYSKLCSNHFRAEDFIKQSRDQQMRRKRKRPEPTLLRRRLKPGAVPSIFGVPKYFTDKDALSRNGAALSSSYPETKTFHSRKMALQIENNGAPLTDNTESDDILLMCNHIEGNNESTQSFSGSQKRKSQNSIEAKLKKMRSGSKLDECKDENELFYLSLSEKTKDLPPQQKMELQLQIMGLVYNFLYENNGGRLND